MYEKSTFNDLVSFMTTELNQQLFIRQYEGNKFSISEIGLNRDEEKFTQINFRFEGNGLIVPWFYLKIEKSGIGTKILQWFIQFCLDNNISEIEIRGVGIDKRGMKRLLDIFGFKIKKSGEFMDYIKEI